VSIPGSPRFAGDTEDDSDLRLAVIEAKTNASLKCILRFESESSTELIVAKCCGDESPVTYIVSP
jgi:hypothetical protein